MNKFSYGFHLMTFFGLITVFSFVSGDEPICYDYQDIPPSRCPTKLTCPDYFCTYPDDAGEAAAAGYTYMDINFAGVLYVDSDASCIDGRDEVENSMVAECVQVEGGQYVTPTNIKSSATCYTVYACDSKCQATSQYHTGLSFSVNGTLYPFMIPYYKCKAMEDLGDPLDTITIDYFTCTGDCP